MSLFRDLPVCYNLIFFDSVWLILLLLIILSSLLLQTLLLTSIKMGFFLWLNLNTFLSCPSWQFSFESVALFNPPWVVYPILFEENFEAFESFKDTHERTFMHDSNIKFFLVFDDSSSQLTLSQPPNTINIIKDLDISVEFKGSALPFGLLYSQNREIILKSFVDELQKKVIAPVFRKLSFQPS